MMAKIKSFLLNPWTLAALAVGGGYYFLVARGSEGGGTESVSDGADVFGGGVMPMFISGGMGAGGGNMHSGGDILPLGGEIWQEPDIPLSENPDVRIAEIYADVQRTAINTQADLARRNTLTAQEAAELSKFGFVNQAIKDNNSAPLVNNNFFSKEQYQADREKASAMAASVPQYTTASLANDRTSYQQAAARQDYMSIYNSAKASGHGAQYVASQLGLGQDAVKQWVASQGLKAL